MNRFKRWLNDRYPIDDQGYHYIPVSSLMYWLYRLYQWVRGREPNPFKTNKLS